MRAGTASTAVTRFIHILVCLSMLSAPLVCPPPAAAQSEIGPDAVWEPSQQGYDNMFGCMSTENWEACLQTVMANDGASMAAVAFVQRMNGQGYLYRFEEHGRVDAGILVIPFAANDNGQWLLLNGIPAVFEVRSSSSLDISQHPDYRRLAALFPQVIPWEGDNQFEGVSPLEGGGQRFVFTYPLVNGCHACDMLGVARVAFDFAPDGAFLGNSLVRIDSDHLPQAPPPAQLPTGLIAYHQGSYLWTVQPDGQNPVQRTAQKYIRESQFSPDGRWLAYLQMPEQNPDHYPLQVIDLSSGENRLLLEDALSFTWSPDSRSLTFTPPLPEGMDMCSAQASPEMRGLELVDLASGQVSALAPAINQFPYFWPIWSQDGSVLAFQEPHYCEGAGFFGYYLPAMNRTVVESQRLGWIDFSPDGGRLAYDGITYVGAAEAIYLRDLAGGQVQEFQARKKRDYCCPDWSPDGALIAFKSGEKPADDLSPQTLWVAPAAGGDARQLTNFPVNFFVWSPDGRYLAVTDQSENLMVISADGSYQQVIGKGQVSDWQPSAPPLVIPAEPAPLPSQTPPTQLPRLVEEKQRLIDELKNPKFDITDLFIGPELPAVGLAYDESQAEAWLAALQAYQAAGQLTPEQIAGLERLILFEKGFLKLYRLQARSVDNITRSAIDVLSVTFSLGQAIDRLKTLSDKALFKKAFDKLLIKARQKTLEITNDFLQILASEIADETLREGVQYCLDLNTQYLLLEVQRGENVIDVLRDGAFVVLGHYVLIGGVYIRDTQPILNQASADAQLPQVAGSSLEMALSQSSAVLTPVQVAADEADRVYKETEKAARLPKLIAELADLAAIGTAPSTVGPVIAQIIGSIARALADVHYIKSILANTDVLIDMPQAAYNLEDACFDPQGSALNYPWKVTLKPVGVQSVQPAAAQALASEQSRMQQAQDDYTQALAALLEAARSTDGALLEQRLDPFLQAEEALESRLRLGAARLYASPASSRDLKANLYAAQATAHLQSAAFDVTLASLLAEPQNPDLQAPLAAVGEAASSSMLAYAGLLANNPVELASTPSRLAILSLEYPQNLLPGANFELLVTLANTGSEALSNGEVTVLSPESDQPLASANLGSLAPGGEIQVRLPLQAGPQSTQMLRLEARRAGELDDLRYLQLSLDAETSAIQTLPGETPAPSRFPLWMLACLCVCALMTLVFLMIIGLFAWYQRRKAG